MGAVISARYGNGIIIKIKRTVAVIDIKRYFAKAVRTPLVRTVKNNVLH